MVKHLIFIILIFSTTLLPALTLKESILQVLNKNPEVQAERSNQEAFKHYVDDKKSNFYPRIDFNGYFEDSFVDNDSEDDTVEGKTNKTGYRANLRLEQMLYDGGLTPAEVRQSKSIRDGNLYKTNRNIETIVLNVINAYDGLVQFQELQYLSKNIIQTNEENLLTAKEKEEISGEILETYQVSSKLHFVQEQYLEEIISENRQKSAMERYLGIEKFTHIVCRPTIDKNLVPKSLDEALELAVANNYEVLEQVEKIKERRENIAIANAAFLPNLTFELQKSIDDDLELPDNGVQKETIARLNFNWNLLNGGKDYNRSEQEKLFLKESKADLEVVTKKVIATTKDLYFQFTQNQKRIEVLKQYVNANENIVKVYKEEFDAGTRTFVDILNAEVDLYQSKKTLVNLEFEWFDNYFNLLFTFALLNQSILAMEDTVCVKAQKKRLPKPKASESFDDDLQELLKE